MKNIRLRILNEISNQDTISAATFSFPLRVVFVYQSLRDRLHVCYTPDCIHAHIHKLNLRASIRFAAQYELQQNRKWYILRLAFWHRFSQHLHPSDILFKQLWATGTSLNLRSATQKLVRISLSIDADRHIRSMHVFLNCKAMSLLSISDVYFCRANTEQFVSEPYSNIT